MDPSPWVALNLLELRPLAARRALERFGDPALIAYRLSPAGLGSVPGIGNETVQRILTRRGRLQRDVEQELRRCKRLGVRVVPWGAADYPALLTELPDPPALLYLRGRLADPAVRVAVVGSRRATHYGLTVARGLGSELVSRGIEVVSGGARGVDSAAHRGALEAGGRTVAVLGAGFLHPYPRENVGLFDRMAERGAVLTEFPLGAAPLPGNFPQRNRLISGLCSAVVVVEAAGRSGSLSTATHAAEQGREVMAVPGRVSTEQAEGCHRLIQQGAKLVQEVEDIVSELVPMHPDLLETRGLTSGESDANTQGLSADETAIFRLISGNTEPLQVERLAEMAPFGVARLQAALLGLELRRLVEQLPGRYYLSSPCRPGPGKSGVKGQDSRR